MYGSEGYADQRRACTAARDDESYLARAEQRKGVLGTEHASPTVWYHAPNHSPIKATHGESPLSTTILRIVSEGDIHMAAIVPFCLGRWTFHTADSLTTQE